MAATLERAKPDVDDISKTPAVANACDFEADDSGNILLLDHINLVIADQQAATVFYVMGLGFTRDPYMRVGVSNMGINIGRSQLHLPTAGRMAGGEGSAPQRLRGTVGYVMRELGELAQRLKKVAPLLEGTQFSYQVHADHIDATCPWGNRVRCHAPSPEFGDTELAIAYVEFDVPRGTAAGIARFYREGMLAVTKVEQQGADAVACVTVGVQKLLFRETAAPLPPYDDHHIAIYVANHSGPHRFLLKHNLITEERAHQYRFRDIVDPDSGKPLFTVEHEVRSLKHPVYAKPLINRNPQQSNNYKDRGHDAFRGSY